jgi:hypothetical protein
MTAQSHPTPSPPLARLPPAGSKGQRFASTTAVAPMTEAFVRNVEQFVAGEGVHHAPSHCLTKARSNALVATFRPIS